MEKITLAEYRALREQGFTDEQLVAEGIELPGRQESIARGRQTPAQRVKLGADPTAKDFAMLLPKAVGKAALMSAQSVPVLGPAATRAMGLQDELKSAREQAGPLGLAGELAQGLSGGLGLLKQANRLAQSAGAVGKLGKVTRVALGGSQNTAGGTVNALKRLGTNVGAGGVVGALHGAAASEDPGTGALVGGGLGAAAGTLPSLIGGAVGGYGKLKGWAADRWGNVGQRAGDNLLSEAVYASDDDLGGALANTYARSPSATVFEGSPDAVRRTLAKGLRLDSREATRTRRILAPSAKPTSIVPDIAEAGGIDPTQGRRAAAGTIEQEFAPQITQAYKDVLKGGKWVDSETLREAVAADPLAAERAAEMLRDLTGRRLRLRFDEQGQVANKGPLGLDFYDAFQKELLKNRNHPDPRVATAATRHAQPLLDELGELVPEYPEARALYLEKTLQGEALEQGGDIIRSSRDDVKDADLLLGDITKRGTPEMQPGIATQRQRGAALEVLNEIENTAADPEALVKWLATPNQRAKFELAIPDMQARQRLLVDMQERVLQRLKAAAASGNEAAAELIKEPDTLGRMTPWALAQSLQGSPALAIAQSISTVEAAGLKRGQQLGLEQLAKYAGLPANPNHPETAAMISRIKDLLAKRQAGPQSFAPGPKASALLQAAARTAGGRS